MAAKVVANRSGSPFDFELVEGDSDLLASVVASTDQIPLWTDPENIKRTQRIGRGLFGDVWLATLYEHEVAVKMLPPVIREDSIRAASNILGDLFSKCQELESVRSLQGVSIIDGKLCIVSKFYERSIGEKMSSLKDGKLSPHDVLRYGTDLAQGIMELHSKEILVLNSKPSNFLLDKNDRAVLGDIGVSYLLLRIPLCGTDMIRRLGTPNYMAPEQWQPEVRGPITFETDSWSFACSIVEMLTGVQPWCGKSVDEIHKAVLKRQEKPHIPGGLPPAVQNVIVGCFEYDFRSRPLMQDILSAFKSSQNAVFRDGGWIDVGIMPKKPISNGYSEWFISKDRLQLADKVRSRKPPNSCKPESMEIPEGTIVGLERDSDQHGYVLVSVHGIHDPIRVHGSTLERVTFGLAAGDWVRLKAEGKKHSTVGVLHSINRDGSVVVGFIGLETLWKGSYSELQMAETYCVGQFVRLKSDIFSPRFEWPRKGGCEWATGRISQVLPNGCLVVKFPGRLSFDEASSTFLADPAEVEVISFNNCPTLVKKYQHVEDFHWAVRPILVALGLFTTMKVGFCVGKKMASSRVKGRSNVAPVDGHNGDGHTSGGAAWLPPKVANIIFREEANIPISR